MHNLKSTLDVEVICFDRVNLTFLTEYLDSIIAGTAEMYSVVIAATTSEL